MGLKPKKRAFIIHGWEGSPDQSWFPWLKSNLEQLDMEVYSLSMPDPVNPVMTDWVNFIKFSVSEPDKGTYLIGHSLGAIAILKYLEGLPDGQKIAGAILVAGFPESINLKEIDNFFKNKLDYSKVRNSADAFVAINSDNDPYVPVQQANILKDKLGADLTIIHNGGHLNAGSGYLEFPLVLDKIKELIK